MTEMGRELRSEMRPVNNAAMRPGVSTPNQGVHTPKANGENTGTAPPNNAHYAKRPFDEPIAGEQKVSVEGGTPANRDLVMYEVALSGIDRLRKLRRASAVIIANFVPNRSPHLIRHSHLNPWYVPANVQMDTIQGGLPSFLNGKQMARAYASAASGDDKNAYNTFANILYPVTGAIEAWADRQPTPDEIIDAVNWLAGGVRLDKNYGEIIALKPGGIEAVEKSLGKHFRETNGSSLEQLRQFMTAARRNAAKHNETSSTATIDESIPKTAEHTPGVTAVNFSISGYGEEVQRQAVMLAKSLLPLIVEDTPWGRTALVIMPDLDTVPPEAQPSIEEALRHCRIKEIPVILGIDSLLNESAAEYVAGGAHAILPLDAPQARVLSSVLGMKPRSDHVSTSGGRHGSTGFGVHESHGDSYEKYRNLPQTGNSGFSSDETGGTSYDTGFNIGHGPGPRFFQHELEDIPRDGTDPETGKSQPRRHVLIVDSAGNSHGLFNLLTREFVQPYPPAPELPESHEKDIRNAEGHVQKLKEKFGILVTRLRGKK